MFWKMRTVVRNIMSRYIHLLRSDQSLITLQKFLNFRRLATWGIISKHRTNLLYMKTGGPNEGLEGWVIKASARYNFHACNISFSSVAEYRFTPNGKH